MPGSDLQTAAPRAQTSLAIVSQSTSPTGKSDAIASVNRLIQQVAPFDTNVLVLGESGTGKEVVARAIHAASRRHNKPFVPINCGAIPGELLESELFGHEKGSFTGALSARKGRFEMAEGGTIFLDEIGDMNPTMQVKLLRVLQERMYERVGSSVSQRCDVRIIAATHRNLEAAIANGTFREDLYYRLNVVPVEMPALRERTDDLPELIAALAARVSEQHAVQVQFSSGAIGALQQYRWPGNVRELSNLIERMAIQCTGSVVRIVDLPARYRPENWETAIAEEPALSIGAGATMQTQASVALADIDPVAERHALLGEHAAPNDTELPSGGMDLRNYLETLEQRLILKALQVSGGTVAHAATLLGLRRTTLAEKLRKYGLGGNQLPAAATVATGI
jgi:sigma-54 specific flagellar transcriptional regulator A